jgi:hypothetical protein
MPCCAPRWRWPGTRARALRAFHAGRPGGRGRQAQPGHARAGQLHQRLPAPLPARTRRAGRRHRQRTGRAVEPSALVDRAPQARPSARVAARAGRRQRAGADDAARQRPQVDRGSYLASWRPSALRPARRPFGGLQLAPRGRCSNCPVSPTAPARCRTPPRRWPRRCCSTACCPRAGAAPLRVLDACAAPGGKTAHLLEAGRQAPGGRGDRPRGRCRAQPPHRRDPGARPAGQGVVADAARPAEWWDGTPFDAILLDAPCTASGIVRRHPDVRWLRRESDTAQLAPSRPRCWPRSGRWCGPAAGFSTAPAPCFAKKVRNKLMRFLYTTPTHDCCRRRAICCPKAGRMAVASRTIPRVTTTVSSTPC